MEESFSILRNENFEIGDFLVRWQKARLASLSAAVEDLSDIPQDKREQVLRDVFQNSRKLGTSLTRHLGVVLEITDIVEILKNSGLPCWSGEWAKAANSENAFVLKRKGCAGAERIGSFFCDYWREAIDGLVTGVGEDERLARHGSVGHGDDDCIDVIFNDRRGVKERADAAKALDEIRWGKIPADMELRLVPVQNRFQKMKVKLSLDGYSEGTLYYKLENTEGPLCGGGGKIMHDYLKNGVHEIFPNLKLQDTGPIAVYGEGT